MFSNFVGIKGQHPRFTLIYCKGRKEGRKETDIASSSRNASSHCGKLSKRNSHGSWFARDTSSSRRRDYRRDTFLLVYVETRKLLLPPRLGKGLAPGGGAFDQGALNINYIITHFRIVAPRGKRRPGPGCERLGRRTKRTRHRPRDVSSPRRRCSTGHWVHNRASLAIPGTVDGAAHGPRSRDRGPACPRRPSLQHLPTHEYTHISENFCFARTRVRT